MLLPGSGFSRCMLLIKPGVDRNSMSNPTRTIALSLGSIRERKDAGVVRVRRLPDWLTKRQFVSVV